MRDTLCLRARIALLACLPGLTGCSSSSTPAEADAKGKRAEGKEAPGDGEAKDGRRGPLRDLKARREARKAEIEAKLDAKAGAPQGEPAIDDEKAPGEPMVEPGAEPGQAPVPTPEGAPPPHGTHAGDEALVGYPGDPPYIDGYNPEEATCVSGNWCGSKPDALAVSVAGVAELEGCASRIAGGTKTNEARAAKPRAYEGLSSAPQMQGALNLHGTELARAKAGGEDTCCYHWFEYCSGRPLLGEHGPIVASTRAGTAWDVPEHACAPAPALPSALRQRIAAGWLEDGLAEHASIAAFARATLELLAVGAPPSLLAAAQRAALDEIEHARLCFSLAGRYGGAAVEPGPLGVPAPRVASPAQLAADAFAEGCVGETIAALAAQRAARSVAEPAVRDALVRVADDEARHAALAWSTVAWALAQGGEGVAERLRRTAAALRSEAAPRTPLPAADPHADELAAHGRLDARAHALASREAWAEIIDPMLEELLAAPASADAVAPLPRA